MSSASCLALGLCLRMSLLWLSWLAGSWFSQISSEFGISDLDRIDSPDSPPHSNRPLP